MKYFMILAVILWLTGCGSSSKENSNPPASPQTQDSSKTPPSVPKID
jgi:PBP1b-binding outer membrane lipoprotein LpoB